MGTELPTDEDYKSPAARLRLYDEVLKLPTIEDSSAEMLDAFDQCDEVWHWHGHDGKFIEKLGSMKKALDLGKVFEGLMRPVRLHFWASGQRISLNQEVACVLLGGQWRKPHLSRNDALMLQDCVRAMAERLA